jgi:hypothetical protein
MSINLMRDEAPADARVVSTDIYTARMLAHFRSITTADGRRLPIAAIIVSGRTTFDIKQLRSTALGPNPPALERMPSVFTNSRTTNRSRTQQLQTFGDSVAGALQAGKIPVLAVRHRYADESSTVESDPHLASFIMGMTLSELMPEGVILCCESELPMYGFAYEDGIALAASMGRKNIATRRIIRSQPYWRHAGAFTQQYMRRFTAFAANRVALADTGQNYPSVWVDADPRQPFVPRHALVVNDYPTQAPKWWVKDLTAFFRPSPNPEDVDPATVMENYSRWLLAKRAAMTPSAADVVQPPARPVETPGDSPESIPNRTVA